jgi:hypothetical protein
MHTRDAARRSHGAPNWLACLCCRPAMQSTCPGGRGSPCGPPARPACPALQQRSSSAPSGWRGRSGSAALAVLLLLLLFVLFLLLFRLFEALNLLAKRPRRAEWGTHGGRPAAARGGSVRCSAQPRAAGAHATGHASHALAAHRAVTAGAGGLQWLPLQALQGREGGAAAPPHGRACPPTSAMISCMRTGLSLMRFSCSCSWRLMASSGSAFRRCHASFWLAGVSVL